jgi:hypothetical protein
MAMFNMNYDLEGTQYPEPWVSESNASALAQMFSGWNSDIRNLVEVSTQPALCGVCSYADEVHRRT